MVINFIERFTEVHDNDISLLTLIETVCYFLCETNELSLTDVFEKKNAEKQKYLLPFL